MKTSEQINELAAALAKAQGDITNAGKDKTNPHFQSRYATLASTWDACRAPLSKNGLSVVQVVDGDLLISRLLHSTCQFIESTMGIKPTQNSPQGFGSALTYARRYSLQALVGIAPGDDVGQDDEDDANEGSGIQPPTAETQAANQHYAGNTGPVITPKNARQGVLPDSSAEWTFSFGKWKGRTVENVYIDPKEGPQALAGYVDYLEHSATPQKPLSANAQKAIDQIAGFLGRAENQEFAPPVNEEDVPF
jgi:hypothetical protein